MSSGLTCPSIATGRSEGSARSYLIHFDNHFQFENGAFFQLPGFNMTGEGLEEPFEIRDGIVIPPGS